MAIFFLIFEFLMQRDLWKCWSFLKFMKIHNAGNGESLADHTQLSRKNSSFKQLFFQTWYLPLKNWRDWRDFLVHRPWWRNAGKHVLRNFKEDSKIFRPLIFSLFPENDRSRVFEIFWVFEEVVMKKQGQSCSPSKKVCKGDDHLLFGDQMNFT